MPKCYDCDPNHANALYHDGYCRVHWNFHFAGMSNRERMKEKARLRTIRREYSKARERENATNNSLR